MIRILTQKVEPVISALMYGLALGLVSVHSVRLKGKLNNLLKSWTWWRQKKGFGLYQNECRVSSFYCLPSLYRYFPLNFLRLNFDANCFFMFLFYFIFRLSLTPFAKMRSPIPWPLRMTPSSVAHAPHFSSQHWLASNVSGSTYDNIQYSF